MTGNASEVVSGRWLTAAEVGRASDLREDLVERFLPAENPPEPLYSRDLVAVARFVGELTDLGTPAPAVDVAVAELRARPDAAFRNALRTGSPRPALGAGRVRVGAAVVAALLAGAVVGGLVAYGSGGDGGSVPRPAQAEAILPAVNDAAAALPAKQDPVCREWGRASAKYGAKLRSWTNTDPRIPAERWSAKQRGVTMAVIPVMKEEAAGLRRMADKATDPMLVGLLRGQAAYEDAYANRLPKFSPGDHALWKAASSLSSSVNAVCSAAR